MNLVITQEHIDKANRLKLLSRYDVNRHCVLAVALAEQYPRETKEYNNPFTVLGLLTGYSHPAYKLASELSGRFDNMLEIKPCTLRWRKRKETL